MNISYIRSTEDHAHAVRRIATLWSARENSPEFEELNVLATLVDEYERRHVVMHTLTPVEAIKAHMELTGRTQADLAALIGVSRASEILNRVRPLSIEMIRALSKDWGIPAESLISSYPVRAVPKTSGRKTDKSSQASHKSKAA